METVRTWARWTSTALGASLLVPAAIVVVAAGVAVGGSGLGGFHALGQLIDGPRDPLGAVETLGEVERDLARERAAEVASAAIAPRPARTGERHAGGNGRRAGGDGERSGGGERQAPPRRERPGNDGGGVVTPPPADGGGDAGGGAGGEQPARQPGVLQPLRDGAGSLVQQLPEPVQPIAGELVDRVVDLGEQVLGRPGEDGLLGALSGQP